METDKHYLSPFVRFLHLYEGERKKKGGEERKGARHETFVLIKREKRRGKELRKKGMLPMPFSLSYIRRKKRKEEEKKRRGRFPWNLFSMKKKKKKKGDGEGRGGGKGVVLMNSAAALVFQGKKGKGGEEGIKKRDEGTL